MVRQVFSCSWFGVLAGACASVVMISSLAHADPSNPMGPKPLIEIGGGMESNGGGVNVLVKLGIGIRKRLNTSEAPRDIFTKDEVVYAHITGDFAFGAFGEDAGQVLPYMDIRLSALERPVTVTSDRGNSMEGVLSVLPGAIGRNIHLNQDVTVRISVLEVKFNMERVQSEHVALFAQVMADAVGYKYVNYVSDLGPAHLGHLIGVGGELGIKFKIDEDTAIRLVMGGSADINFGGNVGGGFTIQSDMRAYFGIRATLNKFVELFLQAGYSASWNMGHGTFDSSPQILFGVTFYF